MFLVLAAALPFVLTALSTVAFFVVHRLIASQRTDELRETTLQWTRRQLQALGLTGLEVGPAPPGDTGVDAYWPHANYIMLKRGTMARRDPTFWAIGAHELGHALHVRDQPWGLVFPLARALAHAAGRLATAALLVHALLGAHSTAVTVWVVLIAAVLVDLLVLLDEGWASLTARQLLIEDGQLTASQLRRASISLAGAMGAYLAGALGRLAILCALPWLLASASSPALVEGPIQISAMEFFFVAALTVFLLTQAVRTLFRVVRPKRLQRLSDVAPHSLIEAVADLAVALGCLGLVSILWDRGGPWMSVAVVLAAVPLLRPAVSILSYVVLLPVQVVLREVERTAVRGAMLSEGVVPADRVADVPRYGRPTLALKLHNDRPWTVRLVDALRVAYLPLLAVFWMGWSLGLTL